MPEKTTEKKKSASPPPKKKVPEFVKGVIVAFAVALLIRTFLIQAFAIPTGSMLPTMQVGDYLFANKFAYGVDVPFSDYHIPGYAEPSTGDVVVFKPSHVPNILFVKRIVGVPGDTLQMRNKQLYKNSREVPEEYVRHTRAMADTASSSGMNWQKKFLGTEISADLYQPTRDNWGPIVVPDSSYFVLGDNRDESLDSRYWGFIERKNILGSPMIIFFSFDPAIERGLPVFGAARWGRIGSSPWNDF